MKLLFIDNIDSFTFNVVHLLAQQGAAPDVIAGDDELLIPEVMDGYDALVVGPGPGLPRDHPRMLAVLRETIAQRKPTFGVCLGLQAIGEILGARVVHAPRLMHGKTSAIEHDGIGVFTGLPPAFIATRYHSLCLKAGSLPAALRVVAHSDDGVIQGIAHDDLPVHAVQFHPESILSEHGDRLACNFLEIAAAVRA